MKLGIITDTHWGARSDSLAFIEYTKKFLDEVFFPTLEEHDIKVVYHLGDLVERRKYINFYTLNRMKQDFFKRLEAMGIQVHIIAGNHDTYFKETNEINALRELVVGKFSNVKVYSKWATEVVEDDVPILLVPWINDENREDTYNRIKTTKAQICFGHLQLTRFEMFKGHEITEGEDPTTFRKFDVVLSGHYHHKSSKDNIHYLGSILQTDWGDYGDQRGFHIFDTSTRSLTYFKNPFEPFQKVFYNDKDKQLEDLMSEDLSHVKGCYVKVIVQEKINPYWFDLFMEKIESIGVENVQPVEDHHNLGEIDDSDIVDGAEDTITIIRAAVDQIGDDNLDKEELKKELTDLYREAMTQ